MSHSVVGKTHVVNRDDQVWVRISMLHWRGGACVCAVYIGSYHELENRRGACVRLFLRHSEHVVWRILVLADLRHVLAIDNGPRWARSPGLAHLSLLGGNCRYPDVDWHHTVADGQRAQASLRGALNNLPSLRLLSPSIENRHAFDLPLLRRRFYFACARRQRAECSTGRDARDAIAVQRNSRRPVLTAFPEKSCRLSKPEIPQQ